VITGCVPFHAPRKTLNAIEGLRGPAPRRYNGEDELVAHDALTLIRSRATPPPVEHCALVADKQ
jgi:hypothetical protein